MRSLYLLQKKRYNERTLKKTREGGSILLFSKSTKKICLLCLLIKDFKRRLCKARISSCIPCSCLVSLLRKNKRRSDTKQKILAAPFLLRVKSLIRDTKRRLRREKRKKLVFVCFPFLLRVLLRDP